MNTYQKILLFGNLAAAPFLAQGQTQTSPTDPQQPEERVRPGQISLIYPLGTNGTEAPRITNMLSFNLIAGVSGGVRGTELGGFLNVTKGRVQGVQLSGFGNLVADNMQGVQLAGFGNINGGSVEGVQAAGFMNLNGGGAAGPQLAGFMNLNGGANQAFQLAGFMNISGGASADGGAGGSGPQVAGFGNIAGGKVRGAQVAGFMNVGEEVAGAQIAGFLNVAGRVKGVQIGFLNVADDVDGAPIGFLSFVKNGTKAATVFSNEAMPANVGVKLGSRKVYNLLSFGFNPDHSVYRYSFGWGIGHHSSFGTSRFFLDKDVMVQSLHNPEFRSDLSLLASARLLPALRIGNAFSLYAGPTFNYFISDFSDGTDFGWKPVFTRSPSFTRSTSHRAWFGLTGGLQVNF